MEPESRPYVISHTLARRRALPLALLLRSTGRFLVESLLNPKQTADLASLLSAVSSQARLGSGYRDQAGYWAGQVGPRLAAGDVQSIAWLLEDVAGSPWLPEPMQQWARAWAMTIRELTSGHDAF
jgi:hypothetical protein